LRREASVGFRQNWHPGLDSRLDVLGAAQELADIDAHGFNLHKLKGNRAGEWAISVSGNWRITFKFVNVEASDVSLEDYH